MEWKIGHIVNLPKKGELGDCQNWRESSFYPSQAKSSPDCWRCQKSRGSQTVREKQAGFRADRSSTDQIATLRVIIKQSLEWQSPLYVCFVDFKKALEWWTEQCMIWRILRHYGIPQKIVNVTQSLYEDTSRRVIHNAHLSAPFTVNTTVRRLYRFHTHLFTGNLLGDENNNGTAEGYLVDPHAEAGGPGLCRRC